MCASMQRAIVQRDCWNMGQAGPKRTGPLPTIQAHVPVLAFPCPNIPHSMHHQSRTIGAVGALHRFPECRPPIHQREELFFLRDISGSSICTNARCERPGGCPYKVTPFQPHPLDTCEGHDGYRWRVPVGPEPKPQMHKSYTEEEELEEDDLLYSGKG